MPPCRATARLGASVASRAIRGKVSARTFSNSQRVWAAQNFVMPAMSPTMTEGNITKWNFKEGDSFSTGDVLLDIETDKAQMDVEAQEDGLLAKILQPNGSKAIKVGARIAVLAEQGDDLSSLEMPAEESKGQTLSETPEGEASQQQQHSSPKPAQRTEKAVESSAPTQGSVQAPQKYPLYPAVQALLRENGLSVDEANKIPASGPGGRLLKGDVLSHIGRIQKEYSAQQSTRITKMGHLDLSNVQKAEPKPQPKAAPPPKQEPKIEADPDTEVAVSISLGAVLGTQKRIKDTLGLVLPLSTFIARASEIANEGLPRAKHAPTADELYDAVLGLDKVKKSSKGSYSPQVTALAPTSFEQDAPNASKRSTEDVIDLLTGTAKPNLSLRRASMPPAGGVASMNSTNVFSVSARRGEEKRARTYLERIKTVLEAEPGRCVL